MTTTMTMTMTVFQCIAGNLTRISAGQAGVWGLTAANQVNTVTVTVTDNHSVEKKKKKYGN